MNIRHHLARLATVAGCTLALAVAPFDAVTAKPGDPAVVQSAPLRLSDHPTDAGPVCSGSRRITLGAGRYEWAQAVWHPHSRGWGHRTTTYKLGAGDYAFKVCIDPQDDHYVLFSELRPLNPDWRLARLVSPGFELPVTSSDYYLHAYVRPIVLTP